MYTEHRVLILNVMQVHLLLLSYYLYLKKYKYFLPKINEILYIYIYIYSLFVYLFNNQNIRLNFADKICNSLTR